MAAGFIVTVEHNGETWPLRGTVWAYRMERAQVFDTRAAAQAQLDKAGKFMPAVVYRKAQIVPTESDCPLHCARHAGDGSPDDICPRCGLDLDPWGRKDKEAAADCAFCGALTYEPCARGPRQAACQRPILARIADDIPACVHCGRRRKAGVYCQHAIDASRRTL